MRRPPPGLQLRPRGRRLPRGRLPGEVGSGCFWCACCLRFRWDPHRLVKNFAVCYVNMVVEIKFDIDPSFAITFECQLDDTSSLSTGSATCLTRSFRGWHLASTASATTPTAEPRHLRCACRPHFIVCAWSSKPALEARPLGPEASLSNLKQAAP